MNKPNDLLTKFKDMGEVKYTIIDTADILVDYIPRMLKMGHYLVYSKHADDTLFSAINLETNKTINFGVRGRGPREFIDGYGLKKKDDSTMFVFDRVLQRISFLKLKSDSVVFLHSINIKGTLFDLSPFNDSISIANGGGDYKKNYLVYNMNNCKSTGFIDYPGSCNNDIKDRGKHHIYYSFMIKHPSKNIYAAFKDKQPILDIMGVENDSLFLIKRNMFGHYKWDTKKGTLLPERTDIPYRFFSAKLVATPEHLCALYREKPIYYFLVFDWNGKPLYRYTSPYTVVSFVGDTFSQLYAIVSMNEKYHLVQFSLN